MKLITLSNLKSFYNILLDGFVSPYAKKDDEGNMIKDTYLRKDEANKLVREYAGAPDNAKHADKATKADKAALADNAIHADAADTATSATNADKAAACTGNAATATKLETARKISVAIDGGAASETTFDGTSDVSLSLANPSSKEVNSFFRQSNTSYSVGDIVYVKGEGAKYYLLCTTAGTTGSGDITLPSPIAEKDTVTDGAVTWTIRKIGSEVVMPIGGILPFAGNGAVPAGYLLCDGAAVSRTMYPDLFSVIGTTYGAGDGSTTFNLPDYNTAERFAQGSTVAGTVKQAGLPNITGSFYIGPHKTGSPIVFNTEGAFSTNEMPQPTENSTYGWDKTTIKLLYKCVFDASKSNAIYGNSTTVQPNALTCRYIVKYK